MVQLLGLTSYSLREWVYRNCPTPTWTKDEASRILPFLVLDSDRLSPGISFLRITHGPHFTHGTSHVLGGLGIVTPRVS